MNAPQKIAMANMLVIKVSEDREKVDYCIFGYMKQQQLLEKQLVRAMERAKMTHDFSIVDELKKTERVLIEDPRAVGVSCARQQETW